MESKEPKLPIPEEQPEEESDREFEEMVRYAAILEYDLHAMRRWLARRKSDPAADPQIIAKLEATAQEL